MFKSGQTFQMVGRTLPSNKKGGELTKGGEKGRKERKERKKGEVNKTKGKKGRRKKIE